MKLTIKVIPNSKKDNIIKEDNILKIHVTAQAVDNKANKSLIALLSEFLKVKKSKIKIIKGQKSRLKIIEISDELRT